MAYSKTWMVKQVKENRPEVKFKKRKYINNDGLYLQALLLIVVVILFLCSFFVHELTSSLQLMLSFLMFVMAYNNETSYARNHMTLLYVLCGCLFLISTIIGFLS